MKMASFSLPYLSVTLIFLLVLSICQALELQEIRPRTAARVVGPRGLSKRDFSAFDLQNSQTFLWGSEGKPQVVHALTRTGS
jgi:hypothetical protein